MNNVKTKLIGMKWLIQSLLEEELPNEFKENLRPVLPQVVSVLKDLDKAAVIAFANSLKADDEKLEKEVSAKLGNLPVVAEEK